MSLKLYQVTKDGEHTLTYEGLFDNTVEYYQRLGYNVKYIGDDEDLVGDLKCRKIID